VLSQQRPQAAAAGPSVAPLLQRALAVLGPLVPAQRALVQAQPDWKLELVAAGQVGRSAALDSRLTLLHLSRLAWRS